MTVWMNGALMPLEDAAVSPLDHGLVVGDGVFETLRVYRGVPFAWTRQYTRLRASAAGFVATATRLSPLGGFGPSIRRRNGTMKSNTRDCPAGTCARRSTRPLSHHGRRPMRFIYVMRSTVNPAASITPRNASGE